MTARVTSLAAVATPGIANPCHVPAPLEGRVTGALSAEWAKVRTLPGTGVGQAIVAVVAVLAVTGEYATGMIRATLTASATLEARDHGHRTCL